MCMQAPVEKRVKVLPGGVQWAEADGDLVPACTKPSAESPTQRGHLHGGVCGADGNWGVASAKRTRAESARRPGATTLSRSSLQSCRTKADQNKPARSGMGMQARRAEDKPVTSPPVNQNVPKTEDSDTRGGPLFSFFYILNITRPSPSQSATPANDVCDFRTSVFGKSRTPCVFTPSPAMRPCCRYARLRSATASGQRS